MKSKKKKFRGADLLSPSGLRLIAAANDVDDLSDENRRVGEVGDAA